MAKFCTNCGTSIPDDKNFCTECGSPVTEETPVRQTVPPPVQTPPPILPNYQYQTAPAGDTEPAKGSKYEPITTWGYIGIMLLMCIPIVGLILMMIWAFGGCKKVNKRNLARASLIMMAIGLVISLIMSFAIKALVNTAMEAAGLDSQTIESLVDGENSEEEEATGILGTLGALAALSGDGDGAEGIDGVTNSDIEELEALGDVLNSLEGLTGENSENTEGGSLNDLVEEAIDINQQAEAANDGWPKSLREYPGGTATAVASYRTEISDTTLEEMLAWIEDLKKDGYEFQDFYDFGMTEEDMLSMNGWWATDGEIYLSVSYYDGLVTVDHTKELPDLRGLF